MEEELDVVVVGAGFAGLYLLYHLRKLGYKVKVMEAAGGLGGVWYWQTYPGARVDSEVPLYEFSMEELWRGWNYTERYPTRAEILKYFEYVDKKLDLSKDIYFNTRVVSAEYDNTSNKWRVRTEREGKVTERDRDRERGGKVYTCKFLNLCVGFAAKPYDAPFKGMDAFKGVIHHSNNWPGDVDLRGKRVAVIGTGATGVQIIQEVGPKVGHLTVFQRTPNLALPMANVKLSDEQQAKDKQKYTDLFNLRQKCFGGYFYTSLRKNTFDDPPEVRQALYEQLWAYGDFHFWLAGYRDAYSNEKANLDAYEFWCKKTRARLTNPEMRDKLAPLTPPHAFGTKRPSLERTYFEVYNQPNVDLVDVRVNPIECFTPTGIRTKDGVNHECDVVALATGFDAVTGAMHQIKVKGATGVTLQEKWAHGIRTYLGMTSSDFPNFFFLYGAHAPGAFSNGPTCIEVQGDWVVKCIDHVVKSGKTRIEPTKEAEEKWAKHVNAVFNNTLYARTDSWYVGANIPGKLRESLFYYGGIPKYIRECNQVAEKGYEGFVIRTPSRL